LNAEEILHRERFRQQQQQQRQKQPQEQVQEKLTRPTHQQIPRWPQAFYLTQLTHVVRRGLLNTHNRASQWALTPSFLKQYAFSF
jgi:hypothetical protein